MGFFSHLADRVKGKLPKGSRRSSRWPALRKEFIEKNALCACCGGTKKLEVHHIKPFHLNPELELDPTNLVVLCESKASFNCHLVVGHKLCYRNSNPNVLEDAKLFRERLFV